MNLLFIDAMLFGLLHEYKDKQWRIITFIYGSLFLWCDVG